MVFEKRGFSESQNMQMMAEKKHREDIVRYGKCLYERGFIAATDGNLSVRLDENRLLVTPTCMCKGSLDVDDLVITDLDGNKLEANATFPAKWRCIC